MEALNLIAVAAFAAWRFDTWNSPPRKNGWVGASRSPANNGRFFFCHSLASGHPVRNSKSSRMIPANPPGIRPNPLRVDAGLQRNGCIRVSEVMQADMGQPGLARNATEFTRNPVGMQRRASFVGEDQLVRIRPTRARRQLLSALTNTMESQRLQGSTVERNPSATLRRLRLREHGLVQDRRERRHDRDRSVVEVDIPPAKTERLTAPHTRRRQQHPHGTEPIARHERKEPAKLVGCPRLLLHSRQRRRPRNSCGVS